MRCEICGGQYSQKESSLVCENGHTIQNTVEVLDATGGIFHTRRKRLRKVKRPAKDQSTMDQSVAQHMIFRSLFDEAVDFFKISSKAIFRNFSNFFVLAGEDTGDETSERVFGDYVLSGHTLLALVYLSKRASAEADAKPYFIQDFISEAVKFKLNFRIKDIATRLKLRIRMWAEMLMPDYQLRIISLANQIYQIANFDCFSFNRNEQANQHPTGILLANVEIAKSNIRGLFPHDVPLMLRYFEYCCQRLGITPTDDMRFYFKKYIYVCDWRRMFIPELEFALFIAQYFIEREEFEGTDLEYQVIHFLCISKGRFVRLVNEHAHFLSGLSSPELLIKSREVANAERFANLKRAIWIVDAFKRNMTDSQSNREWSET